jgi:mycothiol synthase
VTPERLAAICDLAMPAERLTADELGVTCLGEGDEVIDHEHGGAAFTVKSFGELHVAWLLLVAVEPAHQRRGVGTWLVERVIERARARGATSLLLGFLAPRYVWPGVDVMNTAANALVEHFGFEMDAVGTDMVIATSFRSPAPAGVMVERETGPGAHDFASGAYPEWVEELDRAVDRGTAFSARSADGRTIGFACHSVWRAGFIGPMATEPDRQHAGVGSALLAALCDDLAAAGSAEAQISWVSNVRFYGKCGATISRVYRTGRLAL